MQEKPMIFYARGRRPLADMEADLTGSDPGLAAQFDRFSTRCGRSPVEHEQQARPKKLIAILLLPLGLLLLSGYAVTGGGQGSTTGCATVAIAMCPASQSARAAAVSAHHEPGPRANGIRAPLRAP
jgi:Protein of unknown function (DUF3040)